MKNKSFTLIELLVVIVIIGILAGVIIVSTSSSISKANIAKVKVFENSIQNELGANMVSRWKLDGNANDAWGSNTGTLGDGATTSTYPTLKSESECVTGKCMYFDGTDDYIDSNLKDIDSDITMSGWLNLSDISGNTAKGLVGIRDVTLNQRMYLGITDIGNLYFCVGNMSCINSGTSLKINNWNFALSVFKKSTGEMKLYLNGLLVGSSSGTRTNSNINYSIGAIMGNSFPSSATYITALIDDVRIYNAALSTSQIKQEYIAGLNSLLANNNISKEEYLNRIENLSLND